MAIAGAVSNKKDKEETMLNSGGSRVKFSLKDRLMQLGLPIDPMRIVGRKYRFDGEDGTTFVGTVSGLRFAFGVLRLVVDNGEISPVKFTKPTDWEFWYKAEDKKKGILEVDRILTNKF